MREMPGVQIDFATSINVRKSPVMGQNGRIMVKSIFATQDEAASRL
jgi:hypothetical protein